MPIKVGKIISSLHKQKRAILEKAAKRCVANIQANAPVGTTGEYRDFWTYKFADEDTVIIFNNGPHRSLTHLIEKGHVVYAGDGSPKWSPAQPHIRPAFEKIRKEVLDDFTKIEITNKGV